MSFASSFWGFVETVKQKSEEIVNIYKEDLSEFSKTIVDDTTTVVQEKLADLQLDKKENNRTKTALRNQNQYQARIALLQKDEHTYTDTPIDKEFEGWANSFNIGAHTETITHLLTSNESVREFHTRLVPAQVSYRDFWCKYYYRLHKLEQEEQRRAALVKSTIENDDEDFNWDDDSDKVEEPPAKVSQKEEEEHKDLEQQVDITAVDATPPQEDTPSPPIPTTTPTTTTTPSAPTPEADKTDIPNPIEPIKELPIDIVPTASGSEDAPQDDIDREIEQKYLQIQSSPTQSSKLAAADEEEWGSWE